MENVLIICGVAVCRLSSLPPSEAIVVYATLLSQCHHVEFEEKRLTDHVLYGCPCVYRCFSYGYLPPTLTVVSCSANYHRVVSLSLPLSLSPSRSVSIVSTCKSVTQIRHGMESGAINEPPFAFLISHECLPENSDTNVFPPFFSYSSYHREMLSGSFFQSDSVESPTEIGTFTGICIWLELSRIKLAQSTLSSRVVNPKPRVLSIHCAYHLVPD